MARHALIAAAVAVAALTPAIASAQNVCEQRKSEQRVGGTLLGAGVGALIGSQLAGHDSRGTGAVLGAVGGGIIGNQASKSNRDCSGYGYYDGSGVWHANVSGYYDRQGHWIAANGGGYYDANGVWRTRGPGYMDSDGYWVADNNARAPQPAYGAPAYAGSYGADVAYTSPRYGIRQREDWLDRQISAGEQDASLTPRESRSVRRDLADIRRREEAYRRPDGTLRDRDRDYLQSRLDSLSDRIRDLRDNDRRGAY
ncbi:glycine zipper 2TM domain-containing protein [Caulobacter sp. KR2-114]|uniref:glycine zipper 2TM domain-containing protein n=1 Tax=Caulobacter sp. KR2-114 TaxID=3400912 RepID=UPI003C0262EC